MWLPLVATFCIWRKFQCRWQGPMFTKSEAGSGV